MEKITKLYELLGMVEHKHFAWAESNHLKLYPQTLIEQYSVRKMVRGRKKSVSMHYCEIIVEINGKAKRVAELKHLHEFLPEEGWKLEQNDKLYETIARLYKYYFDRAHDKRHS